MTKNIFLLMSIAFFCLCSLGLYFLTAHQNAHFDLDSFGYDQIARYFIQHNRLSNPTQETIIPVQTLGYPLFLGVIYKVFGYNFAYVIFFQVVLSLLSIYLLFCIAEMLFDESVAVVVALICSFNLGFLVYSQFILTEIVLVTVLIAAFERLAKYFKTFNTRALGQSGLLYGISVAIKPVALFYTLFLFFFISIYAVVHKKSVIKPVLLFVCCFYVPVSGYMVHNKIQFNTFVVAPLLNENIYYYFLAKLIAQENNITWEQGLQFLDKTFEGKDHNDPSRWDTPKRLFNSFLKNRPFLVVKLWLFNIVKTFGGLYSSQLKFLVNPELKGTETSFFSHHGSLFNRFKLYVTHGTDNYWIYGIALWQALWTIIQYCLVLFGLIQLAIDRRYFFIVFVVSSLGYFSIITGHDGCARYRMMFEYFLILLAAYSIVEIYRIVKQEKKVLFYQIHF